MSRYRTSFTSDGSMLVVVVDREQGGHVARFSWDQEDTHGALGALVTALAAMGDLAGRREQCRARPPVRSRPRVVTSDVSMLGDLDRAIELLEVSELRERAVGT